jgi:predicted DCC family thiol-disulfide oxidoreductase YuxK
MALFSAADPDHVIEPVDLTTVDVRTIHPSLTREACLRAMHVVRRDGRVVAGFDAVALLARHLPLFWLPGLLAAVPGVAPVGRRLYQRVADARPRDVPCSDEVCALPAHRAARRDATTDRVSTADDPRRTHG